jgi:hypothetical protein
LFAGYKASLATTGFTDRSLAMSLAKAPPQQSRNVPALAGGGTYYYSVANIEQVANFKVGHSLA